MSTVTLATSSAWVDDDPDIRPLARALSNLGHQVSINDWRLIPQAHSDMTIIRSCWDYVEAPREFLSWAEDAPNLRNLYEYVSWNSDKRYLNDLLQMGCPVPATVEFPQTSSDLPSSESWIIKPSINSSARNTYRANEPDDVLHVVRRLKQLGHTPLVQAYVPHVDEFSELALVFLRGRPLHAAGKDLPVPVVASQKGDLPQVPHARYRPQKVSHSIWDLGSYVLDALGKIFPGLPKPLFARVDLIRDSDGNEHLLELELIEPSLCLSLFPGSELSLAAAIVDELDQHDNRW